MEIDEFFKYRSELLTEAQDETGFFSASGFLNTILPAILDSKLIESEDYNEAFYSFPDSSLRLLGYSVNESGERLILYLVNEETLTEKNTDNLRVSQKAVYEMQFNKAQKFVLSAIKGDLSNELQETDGVNFLVNQLSSDAGLDEFDMVEFFLITATATVETRGTEMLSKQILFEEDSVKVRFKRDKLKMEKNIGLVKQVVDLNFLYSIHVSQGNRIPLLVEFEKKYHQKIEAIKAADERFFESYLCVLSGSLLADLYKDSGSRMLEKNVRSFLSFTKNSVNSGIKKTIREEPEKFLAYNNGLTITATGKEIKEENGKFFITSLTDFQIVNGGQTTATIFFSRKEGLDVGGIKIMAKINIAKQATEDELDELIANISTNSNAQNRVSKVDLKARSKAMVKLKSLSGSVLTPKGQRWFFERAKGELATMIRRSGSKDALKKYPKERQFTKEDLAKYYTAWGDSPYKVKKGGEKVFREFIEEISGEGKSKAVEIDRLFYENVIARIIMFRGMEKIYASAKIGNLRAAVIPYSISVIFNCTDGSGNERYFNFEKIWIEEKLSQNLSEYLLELMKLMNTLIKKYATSDDPSENSKTKDLWERVRECDELSCFVSSDDTKKIVKAYTMDKQEYKTRIAKYQKKEADFMLVQENIYIQNNGALFYQKLRDQYHNFTPLEKENLEKIIDSVYKHRDISMDLVEAERGIINKMIAYQPDILDAVTVNNDSIFQSTLDLIINRYNAAASDKKNIIAEFNLLKTEAEEKSIKNPAVWLEIGEQLSNGTSPTFQQVYVASSLLSGTKQAAPAGVALLPLNTELMRRMIEWAGIKKALTNGELNYISDYTFGLKILTPFHEANIRRHLDTLIKKGFKI
ncbi:AIPR family protein [Limnovirga soli]|uniref:Abortive phage infection protein n=1 Tax=Limnovirga soli TaxID=2656915 RepID=A0A8J8FK18_9BACT|nr:AIPR family protein [Limnovirga soli]NNV57301.1 abortive phage infection protein [Limnovirga soli]